VWINCERTDRKRKVPSFRAGTQGSPAAKILKGGKMPNNDDTAAKLGSLLIQGFKMLSDACPDCDTPLMQGKNGPKICVNCGDAEAPKSEKPRGQETPKAKAVGHKLPEHGYSEGIPYRPFANPNGPPEAAVFAENVLLKEIKNVAAHLEQTSVEMNNTGDLKARQVQIEYLRQCAETVKALQSIRL